jgi:hypothetical protein
MGLALAVMLPAVIAILLTALDTTDWFAFEPEEDFSPSVIDTGAWLEAPAGRHGFVQIQDGHLAFEDGRPVKFWGANICNARVACENRTAERWARKLAKYGVNCVRLHKFTYPGEAGIAAGGEDSLTMDPEKLDRMDYFARQLRDRGIYYGWSPIFWHRIQPGEAESVLAYEEIASWNEAKGWGDHGLVNFARDIQEIHQQLIVQLLEHRNPYTGLRYGEDPALAFVEMQNEDDIFWGATEAAVEHCPTYKRLLCKMFCEWLRRRYGSQTTLEEAWGAEALRGESLDDENLYPAPSHEHYAPEKLTEDNPDRARLLDQALFLHRTQNSFYARFTECIRETGYRGPLVGSCWQAGSGLPHLLNLRSDALVGIIDRHNYFGGSAGHRLQPGKVATRAMVEGPGSGLLGSGMQQVEDRPFALSEWMSLIPNEWVAEGPPIVAVYGLGLQGWDASYSFATNYDHFTPTIEAPWVYNVDSPTQIGQYPALARMVYRGDVREGEPVAVRKVSFSSLAEGRIGVEETVEQEGDLKRFSGGPPQDALAAGRVVIRFCEEPEESEFVSPASWRDEQMGSVAANTGQLRWNTADRGYFTVDTPGTQAVVGFAGGKRVALGDVIIEPETEFVSLFITALEPGQDIAHSRSVLVTCLARARNTGMVYSEDGTEVLEVGEAPILLEPVEAAITLKRGGSPTVRKLDHVGRQTDVLIPVEKQPEGARFAIGAEYSTLYYQVTY